MVVAVVVFVTVALAVAIIAVVARVATAKEWLVLDRCEKGVTGGSAEFFPWKIPVGQGWFWGVGRALDSGSVDRQEWPRRTS